jgi:hypothetical protein
MTMTTMQLHAEIANQLKLISGNTDLMRKALEYIKGLVGQSEVVKGESERDKTRKFIDSFAGKWDNGYREFKAL